MAPPKKYTKHEKIYRWILGRIQNSEIRIGDQLPTEKSIMERFKVNRTTVRTALAKLEKADMIIRKSGKGTFLIADTPPQFVRTFNRIEIVPNDAITGETVFNTIEKAWIDLPGHIRLILNSKSERHLSFTRVISVDEEPSLIEKTYLSGKLSKIFVDFDTNQPYYPLIEKYAGEQLSHLKIAFTAKIPDASQQKLLNVDATHACIAMQSQLFNTAHQILEVVESLYRGDKYLFTLDSLNFRST